MKPAVSRAGISVVARPRRAVYVKTAGSVSVVMSLCDTRNSMKIAWFDSKLFVSSGRFGYFRSRARLLSRAANQPKRIGLLAPDSELSAISRLLAQSPMKGKAGFAGGVSLLLQLLGRTKGRRG